MKLRRSSFLASAYVYFEAVARSGSIRRAALALHISPSAVSHQIARLEDRMGVPLMERLRDGIRLTAAGEIVLHHARRAAAELERGRAFAEALRGLRAGQCSIAAMEGVASTLLREVLDGLWRQMPNISVQVLVCGSPRAFEALRNAEVDLALAYTAERDPAVVRLGEVALEIGAVMHVRHPLAGRKELRLRDLEGHPVVLPDASLEIAGLVQRGLRRSAAVLQQRLVTNSTALMHGLAQDKAVIAIKSCVGVARGKLRFVPLVDLPARHERLGLYARSSQRLSPAASELASRVVAALPGLAPD